MIDITRENVLAFLTEENIEWFRICIRFDAWYKPNEYGEETLDYARYKHLCAVVDQLSFEGLVLRFSTGSDEIYRKAEVQSGRD